MKMYQTILAATISVMLMACGGGSGKTSTPTPTPTVSEVQAQKVFKEFWDIFDRHYPLMHRKNLNWQQVYDNNVIKITNATSQDELSKLIGGIISNTLKDGHTSATYGQQQEFTYQPEPTPAQSRLKSMLVNTDPLINYDTSSVSNPYISYGTLKNDSNIGYIQSKTFEPVQQSDGEFGKFKQIVDQALTALQNTQGIIVDIRTNGGGQGQFAYYLAGRFATHVPQQVVRMRYKFTTGSTAASLSDWVTSEFQGYPDKRSDGGFIGGTGTELNQFTSSGSFQYNNKVALLTANDSASSAEFFTIAMKTQPQVRSIGDTTFGIFAGSEMITPDSDKQWKFRVSVHDVEVKYQEKFQSLEGIGIKPDETLYPTAQQVIAKQDVHIEAAIRYINQSGSVNKTTCDFTQAASQNSQYDFNGNFAQTFADSPRWPSQSASLKQEKGMATLSANATDTSSALEAWKLYKTPMPYNRSWQISVTTDVPLYWNNNGGNNAQVGAGIFVGKPVASGVSAKVYETNMAAINDGERFAQAQLVANRLGDDPIDVQRVVLNSNQQSAVTAIRFCHSDKTLSYLVDGQPVGKSQAIDGTGLDNWGLTTSDTMDIGIMGFAENTTIQSNSPTLKAFTVSMY